jgi:hypothetical protein
MIEFKINDTIYLNQNYCDRFLPGHMCVDKLYTINYIYYKRSRNGQSFISNYTINHGHSITIFAIDYVRTNRMNNLEKLGV